MYRKILDTRSLDDPGIDSPSGYVAAAKWARVISEWGAKNGQSGRRAPSDA